LSKRRLSKRKETSWKKWKETTKNNSEQQGCRVQGTNLQLASIVLARKETEIKQTPWQLPL